MSFDTDIHIYIFNIDKFNKENVNMRKEDENIMEVPFAVIGKFK